MQGGQVRKKVALQVLLMQEQLQVGQKVQEQAGNQNRPSGKEVIFRKRHQQNGRME